MKRGQKIGNTWRFILLDKSLVLWMTVDDPGGALEALADLSKINPSQLHTSPAQPGSYSARLRLTSLD